MTDGMSLAQSQGMAKPVRYQVVLAKAAPAFERLPVPVQQVLRLCDGTRSVAEIATLSQLPRERTGEIVRRLLTSGVVSPAAELPRRRRITPVALEWLQPPVPVNVPANVNAFSDDEESFFARSIDHLIET